MRNSLQFLLQPRTACLVLILAIGSVAAAQETFQAPSWDLLTMNGSKPNLSASGEGITSYKFDQLFNRGKSSVTLVDPAKLPFKIELPVGYTLYNNLVYGIETETVFTGPCDITFKLPSVTSKETFAQLRILSPEMNFSNPEVPKWNDITLDEEMPERNAQFITAAAIKQRLRNFDARTLHAFTVDNPVVLLVAVRDPTKRRDKLTADLILTGTAPEQVTEGRLITTDLKITNKGPAAATDIELHGVPTVTYENFVSVTPSEGKCRMEAANLYCTFASLEKDHSIDIKIVERCPWYITEPPGTDKRNGLLQKMIELRATEDDPFFENNQLSLQTEVYRDSNESPLIEILSPAEPFKIFSGPAATVPIRLKASDPDGFVKKVELFDDEGKLLGEPVVQANGEYEFIYKDVMFGRHRPRIVATDNLGRPFSLDVPEFFVNGTAKVEIINPKPGSKLNRSDGDFTVTIHAVGGGTKLKTVELERWDSAATPVGNDDYVVKVKNCLRKCTLQAIVIDEKDVETRSEPVEYTIVDPPYPSVSWYDGEYIHSFEAGQTYKVSQLILMSSAIYQPMFEGRVTKLEVLANGTPICADNAPQHGAAEKCLWIPAPGKYKLQVIANDADGAVGKSDPIEITIERP
jgi:hypothetical protein